MAKRSKAFVAAAAKIEEDKFYAPVEAVALAKELAFSKADETVEVAFRLGVDPRKAEEWWLLSQTITLQLSLWICAM